MKIRYSYWYVSPKWTQGDVKTSTGKKNDDGDVSFILCRLTDDRNHPGYSLGHLYLP